MLAASAVHQARRSPAALWPNQSSHTEILYFTSPFDNEYCLYIETVAAVFPDFSGSRSSRFVKPPWPRRWYRQDIYFTRSPSATGIFCLASPDYAFGCARFARHLTHPAVKKKTKQKWTSEGHLSSVIVPTQLTAPRCGKQPRWCCGLVNALDHDLVRCTHVAVLHHWLKPK